LQGRGGTGTNEDRREGPTRRSPGGQVAQSVEQKTENLRVECSIHSLPTTRPTHTTTNFFMSIVISPLCCEPAPTVTLRSPKDNANIDARKCTFCVKN
jgi:hypothetical protein